MGALLFGILSCIAVAGAVGVLLCRQPGRCLPYFLVCGGAVGGLLLLLDLQVIAAMQAVLCVLICGVGLALLPGEDVSNEGSKKNWLPVLVGALGVPLMWSVARGVIGEPVLGAPPMWAVRKGHLVALGEEWSGRHTVLLLLLGVLLLVGIIGATHVAGRGEE